MVPPPLLTLKGNILANAISQLYVAVVGIVIVPQYIKLMGIEAYGLVAFFTMLQAWFNLLDMGFTPTMARETARFRGGIVDLLDYRRLVRTLEGVFLVVAIVGVGAMFTSSSYIATDWLQAGQLPRAEVHASIMLMAMIVALRWMCGLYRGVITGSEQLVWLGGYNSLIATLRFVGVLAVLLLIAATPSVFFRYQLGIAIVELAGLIYKAYRILPGIPRGERMAWSWAPLRPVLKFSITIGAISTIWVMVTQTDKMLLSKLLPLAEYGYFTLAVLVASGVMVISGPISGAIMPRLAILEAQGDHEGLVRIYRQATQLVAVTAGAAALTAAFCAEPLLWAWTGDRILARQAAPILTLYALGNGILAVAAFPYYLQYAKGNLRLHLIGHVGFVLLLVPSLLWSVGRYGGVGAGYVWLTLNALYFVAWVPLVHRKFVPGLHARWLGQDSLLIILAAAGVGFLLSRVIPVSAVRLWQMIEIVGFGVILLLVGAMASSMARGRLRIMLRPAG